jgi:hypothetical protein
MKAQKCVIYGYCDRSGELRYVGRAIRYLSSRHAMHIKQSLSKLFDGKFERNNHFDCWLRKQLNDGYVPIPFVIEECTLGTIVDAEIHMIAYFRSLGCRLTNLTEGGGGIVGYKFSDETKMKMSLATRKLCTEQEKVAEDLYLSGLSLKDTGIRVGVTAQTVLNVLERRGIRRRVFDKKRRTRYCVPDDQPKDNDEASGEGPAHMP